MMKDHVNIVVHAASVSLLASFFSIEEPGSPRHYTNKQSAKIRDSITLIEEGFSDIHVYEYKCFETVISNSFQSTRISLYTGRPCENSDWLSNMVACFLNLQYMYV